MLVEKEFPDAEKWKYKGSGLYMLAYTIETAMYCIDARGILKHIKKA